jgi:hypothetical protein
MKLATILCPISSFNFVFKNRCFRASCQLIESFRLFNDAVHLKLIFCRARGEDNREWCVSGYLEGGCNVLKYYPRIHLKKTDAVWSPHSTNKHSKYKVICINRKFYELFCTNKCCVCNFIVSNYMRALRLIIYACKIPNHLFNSGA